MVNTATTMIIVKGEIKTNEIQDYKYNPNTQKWDITYNNGRTYPFAYLNVEVLHDPERLDPTLYQISRGGMTFFQVSKILSFKGNNETYWRIWFGDGSWRDYRYADLEVEKSCLSEKKSKDLFAYFQQLAQLSDLKIPETGEKILPKRYEKIGFVGRHSALSAYLNPSKISHRKKERIPIFPFGCNGSQYQAVENALENQISVIQGPPGTGKTQTILNIIANVLLQGKTVQVVSNNNAAIENVYEKLQLPEYNLGFLVASLGNTSNKKSFIENQSGCYPDFSSWMQNENIEELPNVIREQSEKLGNAFRKQEKLATLRQELQQLEVELHYFQEYLDETDVKLDAIRLKRKIDSEKLMRLWQECQWISERNEKLGLLFKLKSVLLYGVSDWAFYRQDIAIIITSLQGLFYSKKKSELVQAIAELESENHENDKRLLDDMCSNSMKLLKHFLAKKYSESEKRIIFKEDDLWKNSQAVIDEYPVVLSTTFSSRSSLNPEITYDYLIMDEASQVDISTGALAFANAKSAVIVGDTKQLPNVVTNETKEQSELIFSRYNISEGYKFEKSFLQSILDVIPEVPQVLLREHYRCHPKIINFCNQKFYRGELVIMTEDHDEKDVLKVVKTVVGNHDRNHYNQRQIDVIRDEVILNDIQNMESVGIITPYRNQVEALAATFPQMDVNTVHKFQGREKNTIILSTVDDEITNFADDPYLLNVAVSRAKKQLITVVSGNEQRADRNISDLISYIEYNNFEVVQSKLYSIFDYLYKQYTAERQAFLKGKKKISEYDSENLMYALITDILQEDGYEELDVICHFPLNMLVKDPVLLSEKECRYVMNPATHLDFVIYNRISKKTVLVVEVDGFDFHKDGTRQAKRDRMKDHVLEVYGIPMVRLGTNGSGEREKIEEMLGDVTNK